MADTINELYSKYTEGVEYALEDDRYFQYLFEMIQAGDNTLEQKNRILHKVVDERWLTVVEEGIEAIFNIVDKPRRFITTSEEVVPVALAKKITADSVRHLSQNTQFITTNETGEIMPTKILNVTTEESYDLYENRFVYHLIQRLFAFVDKRTDVIFWSTGDETCNVMRMESKVDDAYEEISYKVEMTIKNRQSLVENDNDNMDIFKRIDRVRRMSRTLRSSSFCEIMNGCAKVHSPIQRTNLMMKDPDYRKCYQLWQFIEGYDEVGYSIEEQDSTLQFDEEYLLQMYINMITNYTVFKSLLVSDPRKMSEIETKKLEPVRPKFIKEIQEEIVEDRNIPDVEIRRVFVDEVTQAQLDAEEKLKEEMARTEELESSISDLQWQMESLNQQIDFLEQTRQQLEEQQDALQKQMEEEQNAMQKQMDEQQNAMQKQMEEEQNAMQKQMDEQQDILHRQMEEERASYENLLAQEKKARADAEDEARQKLESAQKESEQKLKAVNTDATQKIEAAQKDAEQKVKAAQKDAEQKIETAQKDAEQKITSAKKEAADTVTRIEEAAQAEIAAAKKAAQEEVDSVKKAAWIEIEKAQAEVVAFKKKAEEENNALKKESEKQLKASEKAREKAQAKAEANSLSHYIVQVLQERRDRKNSKEDGEDE
ncbi:DUF2357 domain-containing protein [Ruminococcus sp. AF12-5]|mgnify:FL=1|nr:DUF2357 domain-containing protein [Ruminococcus sp. AF12-5]